MDSACSLGEEQEAVLVWMDQSFVHEGHGSAYSSFFEDEMGKMQDIFGRT